MTAEEVIKGLLAAVVPQWLSPATLSEAAGHLEVSANQVRVALTRLRSKGAVEAREGRYRLSRTYRLRHTALGPWRERLQVVVPWSGSYLLAMTGWLPKSDRKAARARHKALSRFGFREVRAGVHVRPANLAPSTAELGAALRARGFDADGWLILARDLPEAQVVGMWERADYRTWADDLRARRSSSGEGAQAAVDAFHCGHRYIKLALQDPLLPDAWVDGPGRQAFWRELKTYDDFGKRLWSRLLGNLADREDAA